MAPEGPADISMHTLHPSAYIYIYIYIHTVYTYTHIYIYIYIYNCVYIFIYCERDMPHISFYM